MKKFFAQYKKLHIWLLAGLGLLAAFWLCRGNRQWMNALADNVTTPLRLAFGRFWYRFDVSGMEVLCGMLTAVILGGVIWAAVDIARKPGRRGRALWGWCLGAVNMALSVYLGFCLLWGVNYYTDSFQDRSGIYAQLVAVDDLRAVTELFAQRANAAAAAVTRDEEGRFAEPRQEILAYAPRVYDAAEEQFPFLELEDRGVKPVHFSRIMSRMGFTGVYCPYTGESSVNVDSPACLLPSTIAHELAHQRAIASEQECNFLAVLASTTCGDPVYEYSGWLMGYIHLGNALYRADREAWEQVYRSLAPEVQQDIRTNNAYWKQFEDSTVQKVSDTVYDGFLKSYGDEDGIKSYGTVVDMLVAYYR